MDKQQMKQEAAKNKCIRMLLATVTLAAVMLVWMAWEISRANAAAHYITGYVLTEAAEDTPEETCLCFHLNPRQTRLAVKAVCGSSGALHSLYQSVEGGETGVILTELLADANAESLRTAQSSAGVGLLFRQDEYAGTVQLIGYAPQ